MHSFPASPASNRRRALGRLCAAGLVALALAACGDEIAPTATSAPARTVPAVGASPATGSVVVPSPTRAASAAAGSVVPGSAVAGSAVAGSAVVATPTPTRAPSAVVSTATRTP